MNPEIEKLPTSPHFSEKAIQCLTKLCFRQDSSSIPHVDAIFIFGSSYSLGELSKIIQDLNEKKVSNRIIITGGIVPRPGLSEPLLPQSQMIHGLLKKFLPSEVEVLLEKTSENTFDNVQLGLSLVKRPIHSLCFTTKSFHCGRSYLTLRKFLPETVLFQTSYEPLHPGEPKKMKADDWYCFPEGRARIWGEFLRIRKYGQRGDICIAEVEELLKEIEINT